MVVPGRGFLLNNELTDFDLTPASPSAPDRNLPAAGKRPRSSTSPLDRTITIPPTIGTATGLEFLTRHRILSAAEPSRRGGGGGAAGVLAPR